MSTRYAIRAGACLLILSSLGACASKRPAPMAAVAPPPAPVELPPPAPPAPPAAAPAPAPRELTEEEIFARKRLAELNGEGPLGHVFFDLDSSTLRADGRSGLQRNAEWLRKWGSTRVVVEGHGDSRGTAEYNLSLGERRAAAVKEYLTGLGVSSDRVMIVSKGEEQPFCHEEHETCWQSNRRGHFVVTAK